MLEGGAGGTQNVGTVSLYSIGVVSLYSIGVESLYSVGVISLYSKRYAFWGPGPQGPQGPWDPRDPRVPGTPGTPGPMCQVCVRYVSRTMTPPPDFIPMTFLLFPYNCQAFER